MICEDLVLINYLTCKLVDNYPAVNQNGLSDRIFPLVEVKCVLKQLYSRPSRSITFTAQIITVLQ